MMKRIFPTLLAVALWAAALPVAAQPASERALPFVLAGALALEVEIDACKLPASAKERDELRQAIVRLQQRTGLPDDVIAKIQADMRATKADPEWKPVQVEVCKEMRANFKKHLAEVVGRSQ